MKITQENVKLNNRLTNVALYKYGNSIELKAEKIQILKVSAEFFKK